jgi:hypothetical protein
MLRLVKWIIYLAVIGFVALVGYAYLGPFFGANFAPQSNEIRQEIILETD